MILEMDERFRTTSVVITHDMATCLDVGERVSLLHLGVIRVTCPPQQLLTSSDPDVRKFVEASGVRR
jgi:phospholipid/cholesterol/gamma-HCH transport system ATP-binding protein